MDSTWSDCESDPPGGPNPAYRTGVAVPDLAKEGVSIAWPQSSV